jgi:hypothetical protein
VPIDCPEIDGLARPVRASAPDDTHTEKTAWSHGAFFSAWSSTIASDDVLAKLQELTTEEKLAEKHC